MSSLPPREVIIAAAGELFHKQGYGSVGFDAIIEKAGVSKAQFHQHFSSKAAVGEAWLKRLSRRMEMLHRDLLDKTTDNSRLLRKYFFSMRTWVESNNFRSCQFANTAACYDSESDVALFDLIDKYKRGQRDFFIEVANRIVGERDAPRVGTSIFLIYSGAMTEAQNLRALWPLEDALTAAEEMCGLK